MSQNTDLNMYQGSVYLNSSPIEEKNNACFL